MELAQHTKLKFGQLVCDSMSHTITITVGSVVTSHFLHFIWWRKLKRVLKMILKSKKGPRECFKYNRQIPIYLQFSRELLHCTSISIQLDTGPGESRNQTRPAVMQVDTHLIMSFMEKFKYYCYRLRTINSRNLGLRCLMLRKLNMGMGSPQKVNYSYLFS